MLVVIWLFDVESMCPGNQIFCIVEMIQRQSETVNQTMQETFSFIVAQFKPFKVIYAYDSKGTTEERIRWLLNPTQDLFLQTTTMRDKSIFTCFSWKPNVGQHLNSYINPQSYHNESEKQGQLLWRKMPSRSSICKSKKQTKSPNEFDTRTPAVIFSHTYKPHNYARKSNESTFYLACLERYQTLAKHMYVYTNYRNYDPYIIAAFSVRVH